MISISWSLSTFFNAQLELNTKSPKATSSKRRRFCVSKVTDVWAKASTVSGDANDMIGEDCLKDERDVEETFQIVSQVLAACATGDARSCASFSSSRQEEATTAVPRTACAGFWSRRCFSAQCTLTRVHISATDPVGSIVRVNVNPTLSLINLQLSQTSSSPEGRRNRSYREDENSKPACVIAKQIKPNLKSETGSARTWYTAFSAS